MIARWIPAGSDGPEGDVVVADIGTDHAMLPVALVEADAGIRAIAIDVRSGPISAARATVARSHARARVSVRLADGLHGLAPGEATTVVIAGMGGDTMAGILSARPDVVGGLVRIILQPNSRAVQVRRWIVEHGWALADERLVQENGRVYATLLALRPGDPALDSEAAQAAGRPETWTDAHWELGPHLLRRGDPLLRPELDRCTRVLEGLARARDPDPDKVAALRQRRAALFAALEAGGSASRGAGSCSSRGGDGGSGP